jgi:hypothetical protein
MQEQMSTRPGVIGLLMMSGEHIRIEGSMDKVFADLPGVEK